MTLSAKIPKKICNLTYPARFFGAPAKINLSDADTTMISGQTGRLICDTMPVVSNPEYLLVTGSPPAHPRSLFCALADTYAQRTGQQRQVSARPASHSNEIEVAQ